MQKTGMQRQDMCIGVELLFFMIVRVVAGGQKCFICISKHVIKCPYNIKVEVYVLKYDEYIVYFHEINFIFYLHSFLAKYVLITKIEFKNQSASTV